MAIEMAEEEIPLAMATVTGTTTVSPILQPDTTVASWVITLPVVGQLGGGGVLAFTVIVAVAVAVPQELVTE